MTSAATYFLTLLFWDIKVQFSYYFWLVGLIITAVWLLLFSLLTPQFSAQWIPVLIFEDIGQIGLIFIAGILFLERRQGTLAVAAIMPVSSGTWLAIKVTSLSLLCSCCALAVVFFNVESVNWLRIIPAVMLTSALFTLTGFILVCPFQKVMNFFVVMALALGVLNIPALSYLDVFDSGLLWLLPTQAAMQVLEGSFHTMSTGTFLTALLILCGWVVFFHSLGVMIYRRVVSDA